MNYEMQRYGTWDMTWDDAATPIPENLQTVEPIEPVIDPNGWHWYPDNNGELFTLYFDADANECMMWRLQDDGSFYWRCANVGYNCRDIGIEDRRGIFFENHLVGTMILDENLTVLWLPETYIDQDNIINDNDINDNDINVINDNDINVINDNDINYFNVIDISDLSDEDDHNDP
jgi:hypothetical protein